MDIFGLIGKGIGATGLDVDNALYMTSMTGAVEEEEQNTLILWGIVAEFIGRVAMLAIAVYVFSGDEPLFTIGGLGFTAPMVGALIAGVFLLWTNVGDLYNFLSGKQQQEKSIEKRAVTRVLGEMTAVNMLLSIDTVVAVAGMTDAFWGMVLIVSVSSVIRLLFVRQIAGFVNAHPEVTIVTSSFLILVGASLVAQGFAENFPDGWFYTGVAIAFGGMLWYRHDRSSPGKAPSAGSDAPTPARST